MLVLTIILWIVAVNSNIIKALSWSYLCGGLCLLYSVCLCVCVCFTCRQIFVNTRYQCFLDTAFETLTSEDVQSYAICDNFFDNDEWKTVLKHQSSKHNIFSVAILVLIMHMCTLFSLRSHFYTSFSGVYVWIFFSLEDLL